MTPSESFAQWRPDTLVPSHREAYEAGWRACAAFYDGKSSLPLGGGEDYTSARSILTAEDVYAIYPRKVGKLGALKAIEKAAKAKGWLELFEKTKAYAAAVSKWPAADRQFVPHPATFFNRGSYDDDPKEWQRGTAQQTIRTAN